MIESTKQGLAIDAELFFSSLVGRSASTKKLYRILLAHFSEFVGSIELQTQDVDRFFQHLEAVHKYKKNTLRAYVNILRIFFRFVKRDDLREHIKAIRPSKTLPLVPKSSEIEAIVACAEGLQYKMIIQILARTGMRVGELCNLYIEDIDLPNLRLVVRGRGEWSPKGGKERAVRIDMETACLITEYIGNRKAGRLTDVTTATVRSVIRKAARRAQVTNADKITPHKLRHFFACNFLQKGGDLRSLQKLLGHSEISTTEIYLDYSYDMVSQAYDKVFGAEKQ